MVGVMVGQHYCIVWGTERTPTGMMRKASMFHGMVRFVDGRAVLAEFIAMALFVFFGCGVAAGNGASTPDTKLLVAFAFGMGVLVLAYATGHHSGGHVNCAVTFSLVLGGQVPWWQGIPDTIAQFAGSLVGAGLLAAVFPCEQDHTASLGTNVINDKYGIGRAMLGEIVCTFLLCLVVWETAVSPLSKVHQNACISIGFAVFLAHLVLLPVDGCSINPTRSFGPAVVAAARKCEGFQSTGLKHLWVMFVGPLLGAALAAGVKMAFVPWEWDEEEQINFEAPMLDAGGDNKRASRTSRMTLHLSKEVHTPAVQAPRHSLHPVPCTGETE